MPIPELDADSLLPQDISDEQLQQAVEQIGRMYRALSALHQEVLPLSRQQFALLAEGPLEELRRLEREISVYLDQSFVTADETIGDKQEGANAA